MLFPWNSPPTRASGLRASKLLMSCSEREPSSERLEEEWKPGRLSLGLCSIELPLPFFAPILDFRPERRRPKNEDFFFVFCGEGVAEWVEFTEAAARLVVACSSCCSCTRFCCRRLSTSLSRIKTLDLSSELSVLSRYETCCSSSSL